MQFLMTISRDKQVSLFVLFRKDYSTSVFIKNKNCINGGWLLISRWDD